MTSNSHSRLANVADGQSLTIASGMSVLGRGQLGDNTSTLVNNGIIDANSTGFLTVDPGSGGMTNNSTMRASGTATMILSDGTFDNTNGTIEAVADGNVDFVGDACVVGGILNSSDNGEFHVNNSDSGILDGNITNNATINIFGSNSITRLKIADGTVLNGTGNITLNATNHSRLSAVADGDTFTITSGQTVQGRGRVGDDLANIINDGLIDASLSGTLWVDPTNSGSVTNNNIMRASASGANLVLLDGVFNNQSGLIEAGDGATVSLEGGRVVGGTLNSVGSGIFRVQNGDTGELEGNVTNNAAINIFGSNSFTSLKLANGTVLDGNGSVTLNTNNLSKLASIAGGETFTIGANQTVNGRGIVVCSCWKLVGVGLLEW